MAHVDRLLPDAKAGGVVHGTRLSTQQGGGSRILRILLEETEGGLTSAAEAIQDGTPTFVLRSPDRIRDEGALAQWSDER